MTTRHLVSLTPKMHIDEEAPLPPEMAMGKEFYDTIKLKNRESI